MKKKGKDLDAGFDSFKDRKGNIYDILMPINYYGHSYECAIVYDRTNDKECYKKMSSDGYYEVLE